VLGDALLLVQKSLRRQTNYEQLHVVQARKVCVEAQTFGMIAACVSFTKA
jgi:hypothetical protein